jgi:urate oxidase
MSVQTGISGPRVSSDEVQFDHTEYGKSQVKVLHIRRDGPVHYVREAEVCSWLTLNTVKDYIRGDNEKIVATDSQKNTIFALAKEHGISTPEEFGLILTNHFLSKYPFVKSAKVTIEDFPWKRMSCKGGKEHVHAFLHSPEAIRTAKVVQNRGERARVSAGIHHLRIMKTTQSGFTDFVRDEYTSLPETDDRVFSTNVDAEWDYSTVLGVDFTDAWLKVKTAILDQFAGPPETGKYSASVQQTVYLAEKDALRKVPQISAIQMRCPNIHYFNVDFSKLPQLGFNSNNEVFIPSEKPSGNIFARIHRKEQSKL